MTTIAGYVLHKLKREIKYICVPFLNLLEWGHSVLFVQTPNTLSSKHLRVSNIYQSFAIDLREPTLDTGGLVSWSCTTRWRYLKGILKRKGSIRRWSPFFGLYDLWPCSLNCVCPASIFSGFAYRRSLLNMDEFLSVSFTESCAVIASIRIIEITALTIACGS